MKRKLIVLKPEQEAAIRDFSVDRMSIYQIPVGHYMVTTIIHMSLRRYVFKTCLNVSEYTESFTFEGKGLKYFGNMYRAIYCAAG